MRDEIWAEAEKSLQSLTGSEKARCEWMPGDASNRFYGRILDSQKRSWILMVMNAPEAFKSEEATASGAKKEAELPFVGVGRGLEERGLRVPKILYVDPAYRFLICEDLGDELLFFKRQNDPAIEWYERAIDQMILLQKMKPFEPLSSRAFNEELLNWEWEHFVEYALLKRKKVNDPILKEIRNFGAGICSRMAKAKQVVVHRDFHSKNLLVLEKEKKIGVIDFQDALLGPATYDLASLLRDSYVRLSPEEEERLLSYYEKSSPHGLDRRLYAETSLQRNLKAVGRFFYISMVKGKDTHLPFVKPSLLRVFQTLREINEIRILSLLEGLLADDIR